MGRKNTIRIDYGALPVKPGLPKAQKFCAEQLGLKRGEVIRIQNSRILNVTYVTVVDLALANKVCEEYGNVHEMTGTDKKKYPVNITMEDGTVLHDLSADVPNDEVAKFLEQYGDVHDAYEDQLGDDQEFAGAFTGIRIAKMVVKKNIESWVTVNNELSCLSYFGQRQTCRHCREFLHTGVGCVQNKKLFVQKSYADAAKQPAKPQPAKPKQKTPPQPQLPKEDGKKKQEGGLPNSTETPIENLVEASTSKDGSSEKEAMPPPAPPSGPGNQQFPADGEIENKAEGDGNETDSLTGSRRSKRNKNKRQKYNEQNDEEDL